MISECEVAECERPARCKALCQTHYKQHRAGKPFTPINAALSRAVAVGECEFNGCSALVNGRGLCGTHYARWRRHGDATITLHVGRHSNPVCVISGCPKPTKTKTMCDSHSVRARRWSLTDMQLNQILLIEKCQTCGAESGDGSLQVDHDHNCCDGNYSCGDCIRGIICGNCNFILGNARDSPTVLRSLIAYLDKYQT